MVCIRTILNRSKKKIEMREFKNRGEGKKKQKKKKRGK